MAFTTAENVRLRFQLGDADAALIDACIEEAHIEVLRFLDPCYSAETPPDAVVLGETHLAGAAVLRALAAKDAVEQRRLSIGGQRIEEGQRFESLRVAAAAAVEQAWGCLEPFVVERPASVPIDVSDTSPVLGEE